MKLRQLSLRGIRGVRESLTLPLDGRSAVIYGDNGTGKSSITDSIEWFYTRKIEHLVSEEIDLLEALRNCFVPRTTKSSVALNYTDSNVDATRSISFKNGRFVSTLDKAAKGFDSYHLESTKEKLILRFEDLTDFIGVSKGVKLKELSEIIGYGEVTKMKEILRKSLSSIKTEFKSQNFEGQLVYQRKNLIEKLGALVTREADLITEVNNLVRPLQLPVEARSLSDIDTVLGQLRRPLNAKLLVELKYLETLQSILTVLKDEAKILNIGYEHYLKEFGSIASNVDKILQTYLRELLALGDTVLSKKYHKADSCPLCLKPQNPTELQKSIQKRLAEMEKSAKEKAVFDNAKNAVVSTATERLRRLSSIDSDVHLNTAEYGEIKEAIAKIKAKINLQLESGNIKVTSGNKPKTVSEAGLTASDFTILDIIQSKIKVLQAASKEDSKTVLHSKISSGRDAFVQLTHLNAEREKFEAQQKSLELIYSDFIEKQKAGLEMFINTFSDKIREFYEYMNPGEQFKNIQIVTLVGQEDNLNGVTVKYTFNDAEESPPQKHFSESHLNCFGLSFFLASIVAFNKTNKFFVLDDVISSFDRNHRIKFANLLVEKFKDYQIILLTHEQEWFDYVRPLAKRNSWIVKELRSTEDRGTHFDDRPEEAKAYITELLAKGEIDSLANRIRIYLEGTLKAIAANLEVKVAYRTNETNEKRMANELISELKSKISKYSVDLKAKFNVIERVENSNILGNILSHHNSFTPSLGDLQALWTDVIELEKLFVCQDPTCKKNAVSLLHYDTVAKIVRCGCGKTGYAWKE